MSSNRIRIDGETFLWEPVTTVAATGTTVSRTHVQVFWLEGGNSEKRFEIGLLAKWNRGAGWKVLPRLGSHRRAAESRMGLARSRPVGVRYLLALARTEHALSVLDKVRLRIVRDEGDSLVDVSRILPPVPASLAVAA